MSERAECLPLVTDTSPPREDGPRVVFETDRVTVWHGDALDVLPTIETESMGLIVTDPPYGQRFESGFRRESFGEIAHDGQGADRDVVHRVLQECVRLVDQGRHLYVFGPKDVLDGLKVSETADLVWDKGTLSGGDLSAPWGPSFEPITFAVSKHRHAGQVGGGNLSARLRKQAVLRYGRPTGRKVRHPNEKPVGLLRELIESSSRIGDVVLDPFAGSGSTAVAALLSGRRAVVVEKDEQWLPMLLERVQRAVRVAGEIEEAC